MKTIIQTFAVFTACCLLYLSPAQAQTVDSGSCGADLTWELTGNEPDLTLTISGTGEMTDYSSSFSVPWDAYRTSIKTLNLAPDMTSIGSYAFADCRGFIGTLIIPNSVTSIGNSAFAHCSGFTGTLTIPNSVTSIGERAFAYCSGLTGTLIIPNSVTSIGNYAFSDCRGLTSVNIPNSVTTIGNEAFVRCSGLTSVIIGSSSIGNSAFAYCSGLTSLTIGNSVTSIGNSAFRDCSELTGTLNIPNSVTSIGNDAFRFCSGLTSVTIGSSVTTIGNDAFAYCSGFTGTLTIPNSVTSIGERAFAYCSGLTGTLTLPNSVTSISSSAFSGCSGLTSVTIPNSVTSIGNGAFAQCWGLTSVSIGSSVTSIGNDAFWLCSGLTGTLTIPNSVTSIGNDAFRLCSGLTSVTIGSSVTTIGDDAFRNCSGLTGTLTLPNLVTSIGSYAFIDCSGLTAISVDENNTDYASENGVLFNKDKTTLITCPAGKTGAYSVPNSVTSIDSSAFFGCRKLTSVTIGSSVTTIGNEAFSGCSGLTSVTIGSSVTTIGNEAFYDCSGLTDTLTIPNSVTTIGDDAFRNCSGLISVAMGSSVTTIGDDAFRNCSGLTSLTIESSVTSIGNYAFSGCSGLISVIIGSSSIGNYAFSNCSGLTSLTIGNSVTSIGDAAFGSCYRLASMTIGSSVTSIGQAAFGNCSGLTTVTNLSLVPQNVSNHVFSGITLSNLTLTVPTSALEAYLNALVWKDFGTILEYSVPITQTYHSDDKAALRAFLSQPSAETGQTNGERVGLSTADMATWESDETWVENIEGLTWNDEEQKRITQINWASKGLVGNLDLSGVTALTDLGCMDNQLTALDVSNNTTLFRLACNSNQLTALDVSNNTALTELWCEHNQLTTLDVSNNTALFLLSCTRNQLTALDVSNNTALTDLYCYNNQLTALDVSNNTALTYLSCTQNQLSVLDVSNNAALTNLNCSDNQLTALDVSNNTALTNLGCSDNQLTALDVSNNTALTYLGCSDNQLTVLDVSNNTALFLLSCTSNQLTALDVSNNTALAYFDCNVNQLTALDVSNNTALRNLQCYDNRLTALDVSNNTALTNLYCNDNQLTALDVSNNTALRRLQCYNNAIPLLDLYTISQISGITNKQLGTQTLPAAVVNLNTPVAIDTVFNGSGTTFVVTKDGNTADEGSDYSISGGYITFITAGTYRVEISNPAIVTYNPAKVIITYVAGAEWSLSVSVNNSDFGSVTGVSSGSYRNDTVLILTATPNTGYRFVNWTSGETTVSDNNPFTFSLTQDTVLRANFIAIEYSITYELNGGVNHTDNPATYTVESDTITLKAPTRSGYDFAGWTGSNSIAAGSTGDTIVAAQWTAINYTVTYELNGGVNHTDNPATYTVESDTIVLKAPTKTAYNFAGWTEGDSIAAGSTGNKTFTAQWTAIAYNIAYELNGGVNHADNPVTYTVESATITLKAPTRSGYDFAGWTGSNSIAAGSTGDTIVAAQWTAINYTVTYELNGGVNHTDNPATYTVESDTIVLKAPTKTAYNFTGWAEGDSIAAGSTGNKTFTAQWTAIAYTITYELNGGVNHADNPATYTVESATITLKAPTRSGYDFAGWTGSNSIAAGSTGDTIVAAQWTAINYTVTYELNGGVNHTDNPATYTVESDTIFLKAPTKTAYNFTGWTEGDSIAAGSTGNKTFTAQWTAIAYTITYELNGGVNHTDNPAIYTVESATITLKAPTRSGYDFTGWTGSDSIAAGSMGDTIVAAQWTVINYTVGYELNGGVNHAANPASYTVDSAEIVLQAPTKTGYDFAGWAEGNNIAAGSTGDTIFTAQWTAIAYTIAYELNGGVNNSANPATYTIEDAVILQNPTKTGYDFVTWTEGADIAAGSTGDKTFTAQWAVINYTVAYELNGGVNHADNPATYTVDSAEIVLKTPTKAGYDFAGWAEGDSIAAGSTGDKTFTAQWTVITYTIGYELNGGTNHSANPASYTVDSAEIVLKTPTKTGYNFTGWAEGSRIAAGSTGDKTFTAQWTLVAYLITYELDGGVNHADNPASYTIESAAIVLQNPSKEGFNFEGWAEGGSIAAGSTGDKTFTAKWICHEANIEEITIGGVELDEEVTEDGVIEYTAPDCEETSVSLDLGASSQANITINGTPYTAGQEIALQGDVTTVNITVASETGDNVKDYTLQIAAPLNVSSLYYQRWSDVVTINRNPQTNGGYDVSDVRWYKEDGTPVGNSGYIQLQGTETVDDYYTEVKTVETNAWHRVCATEETRSVEKVVAYPNPVARGESVTLQLPESFKGSLLKIYNLQGALVKSDLPLPATSNSINVSDLVSGIYMLHVTNKDGNRKVVKIIVE